MEKRQFDLNERLIDFSVFTLKFTESLPNTRAANHMAGQLIRSCTSPALQYGEALSAESKNDFVHKFKILLKELRETLNSLKIIKRVPLTDQFDKVDKALLECNELISIFVRSIETVKRNSAKTSTK